MPSDPPGRGSRFLPSTALVVGRIESEEGLAALGPDWLVLERSSGNSIPFRTFTWVECWWKRMRQDGLALRDSLAIRTVRTADGRLIAVAPLMLTERPTIGPVRARCLEFIGPDPNMTEVRGVLCEPELGAACYAEIRRDIEASPTFVDWVRWSGIDKAHGAAETFGDTELRADEGAACYVLELPATWEQLRSTRPRNLKESLRKCYNSLKRDGLDVTSRVVRAKAEVAQALDDFFRLHTARSRFEGTVCHRDVFDHPVHRAFLVDVCERFAERGELRIFRLYVDDKLTATRLAFVLGDCLYLYYSGFDVDYAEYSVMTTCVAEAIKSAISEGIGRVNLSTGEDVSKLRWRPSKIAFDEALLMPGGALGRAKFELVTVATRAVAQPWVRRYAKLLARPR